MGDTAPVAQTVKPKRKKKPRKKGDLLPNTRTYRECVRLGLVVDPVEYRIPGSFITKDYLGCIDLIAADVSVGIIGIQACSDGRSGNGARGSDVGARQSKCEAEPRLIRWMQAGATFEIWAWGMKGGIGEEKVPTLRRIRAFLVDGPKLGWHVVQDDTA